MNRMKLRGILLRVQSLEISCYKAQELVEAELNKGRVVLGEGNISRVEWHIGKSENYHSAEFGRRGRLVWEEDK